MSRRIALLLLSLLLLAVPVLTAAAEEELFDTAAAAAAREQGIAALRHRNIDAAIEAFEDAVAAAPDAESYYLLGYAYYVKGKAGDAESRQKAMENFNQAYEINPNFTPSKFKPEDITMPGAQQPAAQSLGAAAPESKKEPVPASAAQPQTAPTGTK